MVRYNLGYAYFNLKDYSNALTNLKTFETDAVNIKTEILSDAKSRIGDCYYITTDYQMAVNYYDKVIDFGLLDVDYAMFQKGFSLGLMNNNKSKVEVLTNLTRKYPSSQYVPNAIFERGRAYIVIEDYQNGEADFNTVISTYPSSPLLQEPLYSLDFFIISLERMTKQLPSLKKLSKTTSRRLKQDML